MTEAQTPQPPAQPTQPPAQPPWQPGSASPNGTYPAGQFQAPAPGGAYPAGLYQPGYPGSVPPDAWSQPAATPPAAARDERPNAAWIAGLVLIAVGGLALLGRWVPDAGEYIVLAIGLVLLVVFLVTREYGALVPAGIVTGIGAGIPLATAYVGELGGGLFLISMGAGFVAIWVLSLLFRLPEHHWWPLVPGLILGTIGASLTAGERGQGIADAIATGWPAVLVIAGVLMLIQAVRNRSA